MKRLELVKINPPMVAQFEKPTQLEIKAFCEFVSSFECNTQETMEKFILDLRENPNREAILLRLVTTLARLIQFIPERYQTLAMCEYAFAKDQELLRYCHHQTEAMCQAIKDHNMIHCFPSAKHKDYQLALRAVVDDGRLLSHVPDEMQTVELVKLAVDNWAKSIRWCRLTKEAEIEEVQIYAITKNLQALVFEPINQNVIDTYKQLCIENKYFPEGLESLGFTQHQLYDMFHERIKWIEVHQIFNLLDDNTKKTVLDDLQAADNMYAINYERVNLNNVHNDDLLFRLVGLGAKYKVHSMSEIEILLALKHDPNFYIKLAGVTLSDELIWKAAKHSPNMLRYLQKFDAEQLALV
jgi:hypothetical protein